MKLHYSVDAYNGGYLVCAWSGDALAESGITTVVTTYEAVVALLTNRLTKDCESFVPPVVAAATLTKPAEVV